MLKDYKKAQTLIEDFNKEFKLTKYGEGENNIISKICTCVELDKPMHIYADQTLNLEFKENKDFYYLMFGLGEDWTPEKSGFEWLVDEHSVFFFERPFGNKVVKVLQKLLPNHEIKYEKNDIMIDGTKNGASLRTGLQQQIGDRYYDNATSSILEKQTSEPLSGMIYILRWDDLQGLNEVFKNSAHHQDRLKNKPGLSTLSDFLDITKEEFEKLLES